MQHKGLMMDKLNALGMEYRPLNLAKTGRKTGETQCELILMLLRLYPSINTVEFRDKFGILSPASRIKELRDQGYPIDTVREVITTVSGKTHFRVARYCINQNTPASDNCDDIAA